MPQIAVVGGGPAGSSFVHYLLELGVAPTDIVLFDRAHFPRPKLCGGALTWRGMQALDEWIGPLGGGARTVGLEFRSTLGRFEIRERGAQQLFDRALLDNALLRRCASAGVEIRQGCRVRGLEAVASGWKLDFAGGPETFRWVVGADGARGVVGRAAGLRGGIVGRLVEGVYEAASSELDPAKLYFDFDPIADGIPGYAWIFPYPKPGTSGLWKIGVMDGRGVHGGAALRSWTEDFAARHGFRRVESKLPGWPEHYWSPRNQAHRPGLILTGEAWGIDPLLGEGIAPAMELSRYAAGRLKLALDRGTDVLRGFERGFRGTVAGTNLRFQHHLAARLYGRHGRRWLRVLFQHEYMRELALAGTEAYGRLAQHMGRLFRAYAWQVVRSGWPSDKAIERPRPPDAAHSQEAETVLRPSSSSTQRPALPEIE